MKRIFVSYAHDDHDLAVRLCDLLEAHSVDAWISARDLPLGRAWDREIEKAILRADAVVVLATPRSVESDYVRAEVEFATDAKKRVIPIVVANAILPIRWRMLQLLQADASLSGDLAEKIVKCFPTGDMGLLMDFLNDSAKVTELRNLIMRNQKWIGLSSGPCCWLYTNFLTGKSRKIDAFQYCSNSDCSSGLFVHLADAYESPFDKSMRPTHATRALITGMATDYSMIQRSMDGPRTHKSKPRNRSGDALHEIFGEIDVEIAFDVHVYLGRRAHYVAAERRALAEEFRKGIQKSFPSCRLSLRTYDRLLGSDEGDDDRK